MGKNFIYWLLLVFIALSHNAFANQQIETYLNNIKSFEAKFQQIDANGKSASGMLYIQKPGKIKWEYHTPKRIVVVGNNNNDRFVYCDYELEEVSYISSKSTLLHFLSKEALKLDTDLKILDYRQPNGELLLTVAEKSPDKQINVSSITLFFTSSPVQLYKLEVLDTQENVIEITLSNIKVNKSIDPNTFIFKNPNFLKPLY